MKPTVAIVRGKFLNRYEMQFFEPLVQKFDITAFGSRYPYHDNFKFHVVKLASPMDLPDFPYKMPVLNRLFTDAHYLVGLENHLKGYDLVHTAETYFRYTQQCLNAKRKGYVKKVIATVLENIPFNNESIGGRKAYKKRAREELDHIIALTNKTKEALLREGADPKKITVLPHFIDTKRFAPDYQTTKRRKNTGKALTILFSGRLEEYKGVRDILTAAIQLHHDPALHGYILHWMFVGNGTLRNQLITEGKRSGLFLSQRSVPYDLMPDVYREADIFIAPSKPTKTFDEQYCTALLEAQAAGLPIVTTKTGGIPENIGSAGILVSPGEITDLTNAVKKLICSPKLRGILSQKARNRAVSVHDITIGASKMSSLYESVLHE